MVSKDAVEKIADLARLELTPTQTSQYTQQLSAIFEHFQKLSQVKTDGIEPLVTPSPMEQYLREDVVEPGFGAEEAMKNAPERQGNLFKVPPVVGE